jgi:hypothetical protein
MMLAASTFSWKGRRGSGMTWAKDMMLESSVVAWAVFFWIEVMNMIREPLVGLSRGRKVMVLRSEERELVIVWRSRDWV